MFVFWLVALVVAYAVWNRARRRYPNPWERAKIAFVSGVIAWFGSFMIAYLAYAP